MSANKSELTWDEKSEYLDRIRNPETRAVALRGYIERCSAFLEYSARQSPWGQQWGVEDAYQHVATFVLEKAIAAEDPSDLPKYWDIRNAIAEGAATQMLSVTVSKYVFQKHGFAMSSFETEVEISDHQSQPQIFDDLTWNRIKAVGEEHLERRELEILGFYMRNPGQIPTIETIATALKLKLETAKRYVRNFRKKMRELPELQMMLSNFMGLASEMQPTVKAVVAIAKSKVTRITSWKRSKITQVHNDELTLNISQIVPLLSSLFDSEPLMVESLLSEEDESDSSFVDRADRTMKACLRVVQNLLQVKDIGFEDSRESLSSNAYRGNRWADFPGFSFPLVI